MTERPSETQHNRYGRARISSRQVDELIGLARGVCADGELNQAEAEFLEKWLAANVQVADSAIVANLYRRIAECLSDGIFDQGERAELLDALSSFGATDFELGEALKSTSLPVCDPPPMLVFPGKNFCFTGTFSFGCRKDCEAAVSDRGGQAGNLTKTTDYLVVGSYATESWKHSTFGHKIEKAAAMRDGGSRIAIVSEQHWTSSL